LGAEGDALECPVSIVVSGVVGLIVVVVAVNWRLVTHTFHLLEICRPILADCGLEGHG
jgi:hypothetical protein